MGAIYYSHNIKPTSPQLLALAVFVDALKPVYVRSTHVHEENVGSLYTIQQEFLLNPGEYVRVGEPVMSGSFRTSMTGAGMNQIVDAMIKMHHIEGWHCMLEYRRDSPSETVMPFLLTPSRNVDLKSVPSLEMDLKLVENALASSRRNTNIVFNNDEIAPNRRPCGDGKTTHKDDCGWFSSGLTLSRPTSLTLLRNLNDRIPGLETPERTSHGQQFDIWQNWGSELELASPEISHSMTSQAILSSSSPMPSQNAGYTGAIWNPSTLIDLNHELTECPFQDKDVDCTLVLSSPIAKPTSSLSLQLGMPSLSLQQSTSTEDSMDCFALECFGDSPPSYNMAVDPIMTNPTSTTLPQCTKSVCSEDSVGYHGCAMNMSPWDVNGYSSMTSSDLQSATLKKSAACMNYEWMLKNSPTSVCMYSAAQTKNAGYGKVSNDSRATSSDMYSVAYEKSAGYLNVDVVEDNPATSVTSSDLHSAAHRQSVECHNGDKGSPATSSEHSWRVQENARSARASCSSVSTQSVQQGPSQVDTANKPRIVRTGGTSERLPEITLQELSQYFSMPITQASKALKVGLTVLKKRCRQYGIPRWPHRKMKSIDSLIYNIQDLAEDQGGKSSARVQNAVRELEDEKRLMEEMPGVELAETTKKLRQACFKANYKRRKLGMAVGIGPCKPPGPLPPSISHSFDILNPSTLIVPTPPNHHTMDHFL